MQLSFYLVKQVGEKCQAYLLQVTNILTTLYINILDSREVFKK